ncbi:rhomboid family intramembrane serine protease [Anaerococcus tetradius]|uniref:rhomboid family intramembrane serine protease n=1 Tax=Anaerococcus tetradius TaxID=33036 RepID=UPI0023EFFE83|nr:rhomboid family intramembrane serine protease [Anaerococcus tetradius]
MSMNFKKLGETKVTTALMLVNIAVFIIMTLHGGSEDIDNLVRFGAMVKPLVKIGQWWRIFTAAFIHIGFFHILFNMYFLYSIGPLFEKLYGSRNFLIIYLLAGIMGNLFTYAFASNNTVSAGASTSLYGIFGLAIGLMINYRDDDILRGLGASFLSIIAINVVYSLFATGIGIQGHIGGFLAGVILAGIFPVVHRQLPMTTIIISLLAFVVLSILFIIIGNKSVGI